MQPERRLIEKSLRTAHIFDNDGLGEAIELFLLFFR